VAKRPGRRPGDSATRADILAAARQAFGERGFTRATIRAIAADADVDPKLVMHYFPSKADLFAAAIDMPVVPSEALAGLAEAAREDLGAALMRMILTIWEDPVARAAWLGMVRSATSDDAAAATLRDFLTEGILDQIGRMLDDPEAPMRVALVAGQIVGLGIARYILRIEPVASASADEILDAVGPTLQRYLTGDLTEGA
jgi:AcrR family transcriptional regulator